MFWMDVHVWLIPYVHPTLPTLKFTKVSPCSYTDLNKILSLPTPMLTTATWLPAVSCFEYQYMRKNLNVSVLTSKTVKHLILQDPMLYSQFWIWISVVWSIITVGSQVLNRAYVLTWRNTFHHSCPLSPSSKLQFVADWKRSSTQYFCTLGFMGDKIMRKPMSLKQLELESCIAFVEIVSLYSCFANVPGRVSNDTAQFVCTLFLKNRWAWTWTQQMQYMQPQQLNLLLPLSLLIHAGMLSGKSSGGPNKVKVRPFDSPWSHTCCKWAHLCCCSRERRPLMYFFFSGGNLLLMREWRSSGRQGGRGLLLRWKEDRGKKRGATRSSVSASVITGPRGKTAEQWPLCVCAYVCVCTITDKTLRFSSSPLSSHAPLLLLLLSSSSVLFVSRAQRPLPRWKGEEIRAGKRVQEGKNSREGSDKGGKQWGLW